MVDPTGLFSLEDQVAAISISTVVLNIAISTMALHTIFSSGANVDGYILSIRGNGFVSGSTYGAGIDVIYDNKSGMLWFGLGVEGGLEPLSLFKNFKKPGLSAMAGAIFNMNNPNEMSGLGVAAFWPMSIMRLMPNVVQGKNKIFGMMRQFAKNVNNGKGGYIGLGQSSSGPGYFLLGPSARQFSALVTMDTKFIPESQLSSDFGNYLAPVVDFITAVSQFNQ